MPVYEHPRSGIRVKHRHIPRTSGTSITKAFKANDWIATHDKVFENHKIPLTECDHDFVIVRNPWHRLQSSFFYFNPHSRPWHDTYFTDLTLWFRNPDNLSTEHLIPQVKFVASDSQIWHFESVNSLHHYLKKTFDIPRVSVTNNRGRTHEYLDNYTGTDQSFCKDYLDLYGTDHDRFGYDLPEGMI